MSPGTRRSNRLTKPLSEPRPDWFLLGLPLLLMVFDTSFEISFQSPFAIRLATVRLGAVLLLGIVAWGMGRGPAGAWAERGFAALLLVAWFAVCGSSFRLHGVPEAMPARLSITAGLLLGPIFLLWAWRRRARLAPVVDEVGRVARPGKAGALLKALLLVAVALFALDRLLGLARADLLVIGTGLALYATFRIRGRRRELGVLG